MTRARKRAPDPVAGPAPEGAVLIAADRQQLQVWIRFDGDEQIAVSFDAAAARELAGAILRAADEVEAAARTNGGLSVC